MMRCTLTFSKDADELYKIFLPENFNPSRAKCSLKKGKDLTFEIAADDPVSLKSCINSILKIVETYEKVSRVK